MISFILEILLEKQKQFQEKLKSDIHSQKFITMSGYALISEVIEAINETPWKPWKKNQSFNLYKFRDEIIDCFHFLFNLCLAADLSASDIYRLYLEKNKINNERYKNGY